MPTARVAWLENGKLRFKLLNEKDIAETEERFRRWQKG